jgi:hypothetical protein
MRTTLTTVAVLATAVAVAACSSATAGSAHHPVRVSPVAKTTAAPSSAPSSRPAPYPSPTHSSHPTTSPTGNSDVERALLVASDLGDGFAAAAPDKPSSLPCTPDRPPVDDQVRHVEKGNAVFVDDIAAEQVSEQIYVYGSVADALRHQTIVTDGLACRHGTMGGAAVTVLGPSDVRRQLSQHPDAAKVWIVRTAQVSGALVAVRLHAVMVQFAVVAQNGNESQLNVKQVVEAGLTKILAVANG